MFENCLFPTGTKFTPAELDDMEKELQEQEDADNLDKLYRNLGLRYSMNLMRESSYLTEDELIEAIDFKRRVN